MPRPWLKRWIAAPLMRLAMTKGENAMEILGLSLTTWLVILALFAIITPILGKQVAKDALMVKDSLQTSEHNFFIILALFLEAGLTGKKRVGEATPIQTWPEEKYIRCMMYGGVWLKFIGNFASLTVFLVLFVVSLVIYLPTAMFRALFSTK